MNSTKDHMVYSYECPACSGEFDVVKSISEVDRAESCAKCNVTAKRIFKSANIRFSGTKVEHAEYNPAFGKVIRNKRERRYEAEKRGMVEVGNDFKSSDSMREHFDSERAYKLDRRYEEA